MAFCSTSVCCLECNMFSDSPTPFSGHKTCNKCRLLASLEARISVIESRLLSLDQGYSIRNPKGPLAKCQLMLISFIPYMEDSVLGLISQDSGLFLKNGGRPFVRQRLSDPSSLTELHLSISDLFLGEQSVKY